MDWHAARTPSWSDASSATPARAPLVGGRAHCAKSTRDRDDGKKKRAAEIGKKKRTAEIDYKDYDSVVGCNEDYKADIVDLETKVTQLKEQGRIHEAPAQSVPFPLDSSEEQGGELSGYVGGGDCSPMQQKIGRGLGRQLLC